MPRFVYKLDPKVEKMTQNDTSLRSIARLQELKQLNLDYIKLPNLYLYSDIVYDLNSFSVENFMKILLCMIVNGKLNYKLRYDNCYCSQADVDNLMNTVQTAFKICHSRFIEYFSGILAVELKCQTHFSGSVIYAVDLEIIFQEHYRGALSDTFKMLKMCEYIKSELVKYQKIRRNMTQYEIARVLFNWVVLHTKYDTTFKRYSYTGYSAVAYGYAVCQGCTALYNALCKCFGISIVGMSGQAYNKAFRTTENHIWSFAYLDGRNVYIDVTWGRPMFENSHDLKKFGVDTDLLCDFEQFDISYRELAKERSWDRALYG